MTAAPFEESAITPERLGQVALVAQVPVFAYLGHVLFDDVLFGGIAGLLVGVGTLLHLPYFLYRSAAAREGVSGVDGDYTRRAAAGLALDAAGIVAIGSRFAVDSAVVALAVAALAALVLFVPLQYALPPVDGGAAA